MASTALMMFLFQAEAGIRDSKVTGVQTCALPIYRYATFVLEDREGVVEVIAWPDTYRRHEAVVQGGAPVVVAGALEISDERCQVIADEILPLARAHAEAIRQVHVRVPLAALERDALATLREVLAAHPGPCDAFLHLERGEESETVLA